MRKYRFVTDKRAEMPPPQIPYRVAGAAAKITGQPRKIPGEPEKVSPGHVFAEGNQMNFIILKFLAALRIEHGGAVISSKPAVCPGFPANDAEEKITSRIAGNLLRAADKIRLAQRKRRGNLRPDD